MALTYAIEGKGVIANADNYGADTAGGSWGVTGSGGASAGTTTDTFYYGTTSISSAVSGANKWAWIYHDIGAGNELDFTGGGTEEGQFIYIWVHCPTIGLSKTLANEGVSIRIGSTTANYRIFVIAGSNGSNGWDGGWQCFVVDPTKTGSISDVGTPNLASIRYIGAQLETTSTAKGDNLFISQIAVGSGLRITGTSTTGWLDAVTYCTDLTNRAWGMLQEREGIYYAYGNIIIGDTAMTSNCSFADQARVVQFGISEYWSGTGTTFNSFLPTTACGITLEDDNVATTYTTTFSDGVLVGSDNGRSGSTIIGNANEDIFLSFAGLANAASVITCYGTTFKDCSGVISLEGDTAHKYYGINFVGCAQVDPGGACQIRNAAFAETVATDAALLWAASIDIQDSNFIANTTGAAIEIATDHGSDGEEDFTALFFSGNTNDVNNTTGSSITVNKLSNSDPSSYTGSLVTFSANYSHVLEGLELNTEVTYVTADTSTELFHVENASTSDGNGKYKTSYTHSGGASVDILIHHISYQPDVSNIYGLTLPNGDATVKVQMFLDINYSNPT